MTNEAKRNLVAVPNRSKVKSIRFQTAALIPGLGTEQTLIADRLPPGVEVFHEEKSNWVTVKTELGESRIPLTNVVVYTVTYDR